MFMSGTSLTMTPAVNIAQAGAVLAFVGHMSETIEQKKALQTAIANATLVAAKNITDLRGGAAGNQIAFLELQEFSLSYGNKLLELCHNGFYNNYNNKINFTAIYDAQLFLHNVNILKDQLGDSINPICTPSVTQTCIYKHSIFDIHWRPIKRIRNSATDLEIQCWFNKPDSAPIENISFLEILKNNKAEICSILIIGGSLFIFYKKSKRFKESVKRIYSIYKSIKNHKLINNPVSSRLIIFTNLMIFIKPL